MNKKGFTLVELLAVIVILAVILVIAIPQILNTIESSRKGSMESSTKLVARELEQKYETSLITSESFNLSGSCIGYGNLDTDEYDTCTYTLTGGKASVTLTGKSGGKFDSYTCTGNKENATCTKGGTITLTVSHFIDDDVILEYCEEDSTQIFCNDFSFVIDSQYKDLTLVEYIDEHAKGVYDDCNYIEVAVTGSKNDTAKLMNVDDDEDPLIFILLESVDDPGILFNSSINKIYEITDEEYNSILNKPIKDLTNLYISFGL